MLPHFNLKKVAEKVQSDFYSYDLHSKETPKIRHRIAEIIDYLGKPSLRGPVTAIVQELLANGLKAVYKKIYFEEVIPNIQMGELSYETKLHLFRIEIDSNQTKNFLRIAEEQGSAVHLRFQALTDGLELMVENPGTPSGIEMHRIESALENAKKLSNLSYIFDDSEGDEEQESQKEGAGLGISMMVMTLKNLGIPLDNLNIYASDGKTYSRVLFPWGIFFDDASEEISILKGRDLSKETIHVMNNLGNYIIKFNSKGALLSISENFLKDYNLPTTKSKIIEMISDEFFDDFFWGVKNITTETKFDYYYTRLNLDKVTALDGEYGSLFQVSAFFNKDSTITSLWKPIPQSMEEKFLPIVQEKFLKALKLQELLQPYISTGIRTKAQEAVKQEAEQISAEVKIVTIFFADLVGFTQKSESISPEMALNLLNIALGILVKSIEDQHGYIDKFMGDAVMAIFDNPLNAVISAVEIQTLFAELNSLRTLTEKEPMNLRIGIHSGEVMLGSVGPKHRRDWTAIGDVVNTASRLEHSSSAGSVLISKTTYELTKESVTFSQGGKLKVKGKQEAVQVYFVKSVKFMKRGRETILHLP